jgi:hypothetical protein
VHFADLDRGVRARLRTLSKDNAEQVGLHLVMTGRLLDSDPELAYEHAQAAVRRAGRVDVVREAAGLAAYRTGRFAEALRELRTVRRLNGSSEHLAIMADCERGLGRPERALALAASDEAGSLEPHDQVELAMVVSGARLDLGEPEAALAALSTGAAARVTPKDGVLATRVDLARAAALEALGRPADATEVLAGYSAADLAAAAGEVDEPVVVWDLADDEDDDAPVDADDAPGQTSVAADDLDRDDEDMNRDDEDMNRDDEDLSGEAGDDPVGDLAEDDGVPVADDVVGGDPHDDAQDDAEAENIAGAGLSDARHDDVSEDAAADAEDDRGHDEDAPDESAVEGRASGRGVADGPGTDDRHEEGAGVPGTSDGQPAADAEERE